MLLMSVVTEVVLKCLSNSFSVYSTSFFFCLQHFLEFLHSGCSSALLKIFSFAIFTAVTEQANARMGQTKWDVKMVSAFSVPK